VMPRYTVDDFTEVVFGCVDIGRCDMTSYFQDEGHDIIAAASGGARRADAAGRSLIAAASLAARQPTHRSSPIQSTFCTCLIWSNIKFNGHTAPVTGYSGQRWST